MWKAVIINFVLFTSPPNPSIFGGVDLLLWRGRAPPPHLPPPPPPTPTKHTHFLKYTHIYFPSTFTSISHPNQTKPKAFKKPCLSFFSTKTILSLSCCPAFTLHKSFFFHFSFLTQLLSQSLFQATL